MDKYEYKLRADEIKSLIGQGRYQEAADLADTIDWRRVKSISMLGTISDLYKINRRYEESKNVLLMAYDRFPEGRSVVYSLCELAIKTGEIVQAIEYYKEFVRVAPADTARYILQYKLYEAQEVSLEERIAVLEELKKHDYRDKWAYELALLYHRAGLKERCVEECDNIALHFEMSRYVARALELKQFHTKLSEEQEARLAIFRKEHPEHIATSAERLGVAAEEKMNLKHFPAQTPASTGNTAEIAGENLEEELQHSVPVSPEEEIPASEVAQYAPLEMPAMQAQVYEEAPQYEQAPVYEAPQPQYAQVPVYEEAQPQYEAAPAYTPEEIPVAEPQEENTPAEVGVSFHTMNLQEELAENLKDVLGEDVPGEAPSNPAVDTKPYANPELYAEDMMDTAATRVFNEQQMAQIHAAAALAPATPPQKPVKEQKQIEPLPFVEVKPGMVIKPNRKPAPNHFERMLTEGADGQISLFVEEEAVVEKQITGQLSIQDVLQQWEDSKRRQQENQMAQVRRRVADETGDMFERFDAEVKDDLHAQLESAVNDAIRKDKYARATGHDGEEAYQDLERTTREIIRANTNRPEEMQIFDLEDDDAEEAPESIRDVAIDNIPDAIEPGDLAEAIERRHAMTGTEGIWASTEEAPEEEDDTPVIDSSLSGMEKVMVAEKLAYHEQEEDDDTLEEETPWEEAAVAEDAAQDDTGEAELVEEEIDDDFNDEDEDDVDDDADDEDDVEDEDDEETPHQSAALTASPQGEAQEADNTEEEDDADVEVEFYEAETSENLPLEEEDEPTTDEQSATEETPPARSIEELRATAPWRMLEEEEAEELKETEDSEDETPHQSAALTAVSAPLRSAQNQGPPDLVRPQGEAQETGDSEEEDEPATPGVTLDEILEQEIAETAIAEDAAENLLPEGSADDIVEEIIEIGGFAEVDEPTEEDLPHEEEVAETSEDLPLEGKVSAEPTDEVSEEPATDEEDEPAREMTGMEKVIAVAAAAAAARESGEELSQEASDEADTDEMQQEDAQEELPDREPGATTGDIPEISAEVASILDGLEEEQPPEETPEALSDLPMEETEETTAQEPAEETEEPQQEEPEETGEHPPENEPEKTRNAKDDDDPVDKEMEARVRAMTQEEKVLFGPYIMQKSARRQIIHAIDNMSMAADVGNAIVTGEEGAGSLSLAKGLIRSVQLSDSNFSGKVAKISGSALNTKEISSIFDQLLDGALIIHKASGMSNETASSLRKALQKETKGMIVILEDNRKAMNRFLKENETLNESFSVRVDIEPLDDDALISYAKKYAEKRGYMIDEFGILALHTVIDDMQTVDHRVTLAEVKEIVDKAIVHADKKDAGYFFDVLLRKRYSDEDMVVLHEKDFMAGR